MSASLAQKYKEIIGGFRSNSADGEENGDQILHSTAVGQEMPATASKPLPLELKYVVQFPDIRGVTRVVAMETYEGRQKYKERDKAYKDFPILHRRKYDTWGDLEKVQLEIQSPILQDLFKDIAPKYRELSLTAKPIVIPHPYRSLFFLREELGKHSKASATPQRTKEELRLLLKFIESEDGLKDIIKSHKEMVLDSDAPGKINFELLWTLFPPHELVYVNPEFDERCLMIDYVTGGFVDSSPTLQCHLFSGWHNGTRFGIATEVFAIPMFPGVIDIVPRNLPLLPLKRLSDLDQLQIRQRLLERGKKYVQLQTAKFSHMSLDSGAITIDPREGNKVLMAVGERKMTTQGKSRVMVDATAFRKDRDPYRPFIAFNIKQIIDVKIDKDAVASSFSSSGSQSSFSYIPPPRLPGPPLPAMVPMMQLPEWIRDETKSELSDLDYLLCPSKTHAFLLTKKLWALVEVSLLHEITWTENAFGYLELEQGKKSLVRGLVEGFNTDEEFGGFDDIVRGKGKGLIFLLHGEPGLGKTMTAETIAEHTHRPLYHLTTGELSTDVTTMEGQLRDIFGHGWRWGAVVLLDEADVLMSKRTLKELARSAIVAVFLRMIEYYQGLLFLTTNRIEEFDPAFHNRIHVTIKYEDLLPKSRKQIWRNLLAKSIDSISLDTSWSDDAFATLSEWKSNGRDIRNLIRTAYGFAKSERANLGLRHVVIVLENILSEKDRREAGDIIKRLHNLASGAEEAKGVEEAEGAGASHSIAA